MFFCCFSWSIFDLVFLTSALVSTDARHTIHCLIVATGTRGFIAEKKKRLEYFSLCPIKVSGFPLCPLYLQLECAIQQCSTFYYTNVQ